MATTNNQALHWILGAALLLIVVFVVGALLLAQSQAATGEVDIDEAAPTINAGADIYQSNVWVGSEAYAGTVINDLLPGASTRAIWIVFQGEDTNGNEDVVDDGNASIALRKSTVAAASCDQASETDNNSCYFNHTGGTCAMQETPGQNLKFDVKCPFALTSWMDATDAGAGADSSNNWIVSVAVNDGEGSTVSQATQRSLNVASALGLLPSPGIDFGTMSVGEATSTTTNVNQTVTNLGNVSQHVNVNMPDATFTCPDSDVKIGRAQLKYRNADGSWGNGDTAITGTNAEVEIGAPKRTSEDTAPTTTLYWGLQIPNGVEGTCTTLINMTGTNANL